MFGTGTGWPDIAVATIMAALALWAGWQIVRQRCPSSALDHLACFFGNSVGGDMSKKAVTTAVLLVCAGAAHGADKEKEPWAILEVSGASEWSLQNGTASLGPSVAAEFDVIKEWLEIEAGFSPLLKQGSSPEWSTDLLFKKPFTLSNTV